MVGRTLAESKHIAGLMRLRDLDDAPGNPGPIVAAVRALERQHTAATDSLPLHPRILCVRCAKELGRTVRSVRRRAAVSGTAGTVLRIQPGARKGNPERTLAALSGGSKPPSR